MDFAAGGSRVPILTRNPTQSTAGFQTFGLPTGSSSGGSANRTTLGAMRMGDQDGNAPASAIYADDIFYPPGQPGRVYPEVTFQSTGNNVYQPETIQTAAATEALLRRIGDQRFKATEEAPFEDYFMTQKLAREVNDAARNAGLEDQGYAREIMRNVVAERRKGNEDDFLRKMLDAGMTPQDAQQEIDTVRRANALQESRKVEDRTHQSKLLIQRIARSRGVLSAVNEPLTTTGAIENPKPNERMAMMSGQPENAYGSSPLDRDRIFKTPDYYNARLTRTGLTQEAGDEMAALATATSQATGPVPTPSMLRGMERENAIERSRDSAAARLDNATNRKRVLLPLPPLAEPFADILRASYRGKEAGSLARFRDEELQDLSAFHAFVAMNQALALEPAMINQLKRLVSEIPTFFEAGRGGAPEVARRDIRAVLRKLSVDLIGATEISIPFGGDSRSIDDLSIANTLQRIKSISKPETKAIESQMREYQRILGEANVPLVTRKLRRTNTLNISLEPEPAPEVRRAPVAAPPVVAAQRLTAAELGTQTLKQLQDTARAMGLSTSGRKATLIERIVGA
jgi:hypothetical protein